MKKIDLEKPLSEEDRAFLVSRNRHDLIAIADSSHKGPVSVPVPGATGHPDLHRLQAFLQANFADEVSTEPSLAASEGPIEAAIRILSKFIDHEPPALSEEPFTDGTTLEDTNEGGIPGGFPEGAAEPDSEDDSVEVPEEFESYEALTVPQLKKVLETRELSRSGNKDELIARLREDDAS